MGYILNWVNIRPSRSQLWFGGQVAASLANCSVIYVAAEECRIDRMTKAVRRYGYLAEPFELDPLFQLTGAILNLNAEQYLILSQIEKEPGKMRTVSDILSAAGLNLDKKSLQGEVPRYTYHNNKAEEKGLQTERDTIEITKLGKLILKLVNIWRTYNPDTSETRE